MTQPDVETARLNTEQVAALRHGIQELRAHGETARARELIQGVGQRYPNDPNVWLIAATVAATRDEQRQALERVLQLDPENALAKRGMQRFQPSSDAVAPAPRATSDIPPAATLEPEPPPTSRPAWMYTLAAGLLVLLVVLVLTRPWQSSTEPASTTPTPPLPSSMPAGQAAPLVTLAPATPVAAATSAAVIATPIAATTAPAANAPTAAPAQPEPSAIPADTSVPAAVVPVLAAGEIAEQGIWRATLLRPDFALILDGSIGPLQPQGRFALARVTVSQTSDQDAVIPITLFTLVDDRGRHYQPLPAASSEYLRSYGANAGNYSLEDAIPAGGNWDVPVIFDVPSDAHGLQLHVGDSQSGWPVGN